MVFKSVTIIRHSEANKTIKSIHGGKGTSLTSRGKNDSIALSKKIESDFLKADTILFSSSRKQVLQTASLVSKEIDINLVVDDGLININMGIFDGKTDVEARNSDPLAMNRLELWRKGDLSVDDIRIPEAENLNEFLVRIKLALELISSQTKNPIIFITRSSGIAVINLLQGYTSENNKKYIRYRLDPGSISTMNFTEGKFSHFSKENYTGYLNGIRQFKND